MEYIIDKLKYIAQDSDTTCWKAAYKMMLNYKLGEAGEAQADKLPNMDKMTERGILDGEFATCRNKLGLSSSTYTGFLTLGELKYKLETYGAIWVSGEYCEAKYKHIIIVRGVRDPMFGEAEVMINDPWSGYKYSLNKPRWITISKFKDKINQVAFACQHWFDKPTA